MGLVRIFFPSIIILCFFSCKQPLVTTESEVNRPMAEFVMKENIMDCFEEGIRFDDGKIYNCELSAVAEYKGALLFGNDKNTSEVSPMLMVGVNDLLNNLKNPPLALKQEEFFAIRKMEDFAFTPDKKFLLLSSGFDRLDENNPEWDAYNTLLQWEIIGDEFHYVDGVENKGIMSSKNLRNKFLDLLKSSHMKIEGLMILPGNRLVFGVRETGEDFNNPIYTSTFIQCTYKITDGKMILNNDMKIVYKFNSDAARKGLGLSSMTYDPERNMVFITSSYEHGEEGKQELGSYIWKLPLSDFNDKKPPQLIYLSDSDPLFMPHKAEGISVLENGDLFIIHDNDRVDIPVNLPDGKVVSRKPHQAVYSIVRLK